ncbi:MAG: hypothetical protein ACREU0_07665, partial [Burkholderiales bacterium]
MDTSISNRIFDPATADRRPSENSIGIVAPQTVHFNTPLACKCGAVLDGYDLVYETYGALNAAKSNAVLVCHALSGTHHVAGYYADDPNNIGWW